MVTTFVLSAILVAIGIAFLFRDKIAALMESAGSTPGAPWGFKEFGYMMVVFLPHILLVFGPLADALSKDFRYTIPSLAAFASIYLNYAAGLLFDKVSGMSKPAPTFGGGSEGCGIPGFESWASPYSSAPMVVTFTTLFYYLMDLWQQRGFYSSGPAMISLLSLAGSQFWILKSNGCFASFSNVGYALGISLALGVLFGGTFYAMVKSADPDRLPSAVAMQGRQTPTSKAPGPAPPAKSDCPGGRCPAPADDDQFVCDSIY